MAWAKARSMPRRKLVAGGVQAVDGDVSGQVATCSARPATGPRDHDGSGRRGATFA